MQTPFLQKASAKFDFKQIVDHYINWKFLDDANDGTMWGVLVIADGFKGSLVAACQQQLPVRSFL